MFISGLQLPIFGYYVPTINVKFIDMPADYLSYIILVG